MESIYGAAEIIPCRFAACWLNSPPLVADDRVAHIIIRGRGYGVNRYGRGGGESGYPSRFIF